MPLTILMAGLSVIGLVVVAGFVVEIARGSTHRPDFWSAGVIVILLTLLLLPATIGRWRGSGTTPSKDEGLRTRLVPAPLLVVGGVAVWIVAPGELSWLGPVMVGSALLSGWSVWRRRRTVKQDEAPRWPRA